MEDHALAQPKKVVHLVRGQADAVAAWRGFARRDLPTLRVDLRAHPDDRFRADRILELHVDAQRGTGSVVLKPGGPVRPAADELALVSREKSDWPAPHLLERFGNTPVREERPGALRAYSTEWWNAHPFAVEGICVAQLAGWPLSWPDSDVDEADKVLVLRTYRDAEPWVEVLGSPEHDEMTVHVRVT